MNWLQTVLALLQLAPSILQTAATVQTIITAPKQGAVKKAIVMAPLALAPPEVQSAASSFIDLSVKHMKAGLAAAAALATAPVLPAPAEPAEV